MSGHVEDLTLAPALPEELDELKALRRRSQSELEEREPPCGQQEAVFLPVIQNANGQMIVAKINGGIVGFAAVVDGELDWLFVEPELRGRGIEKRLVDAAVHQARRLGLTLTVSVNPSARRFYEKFGFTAEVEQETPPGRALRMSK